MLVFQAGGLFAQNEQFSMKVDKNPVAMGDRFRLTITLQNAQGDVSPPDLGDFRVVMGPSRSQSYQIINGRQTSSISLTYIATPLKKGTFKIEPARAKVDGKTMTTEAIELKVIEGKSQPSASQGNSQGRSSGGGSAASASGDSNLKVAINPSRRQVYQGEQIVLEYLLYSRYKNIDLDDFELPELDGFWTEEIDLGNTTWEPGYEMIDGRPFRKAILRKQVIYPQRPGTFNLESFTLTARVNRSFFSSGEKLKVRSNSPSINVKGLPGGKPSAFNGAVGNYRLKSSLDKNTVKANDAINLTVTFSGRGNLKLIDEPSIEFPADFEVYDPKVNDRINVTENGMSGSRTFEYLIIPRRPGEFEIPSFDFAFFNSSSNQYETLKSEAYKVKVEKGEGEDATAYTPGSKTEVQLLERDIRYIHTGSANLTAPGSWFAQSGLFYSLVGAPVLMLVVLVLARRRQAQRQQDVTGMRVRRANKMARRRLKEASKAMESGDKSKFYEEIFKGIYGYLSDKLSIPYGDLNKPTLKREMQKYRVSEELQSKLFEHIERCEMARFAPVSDISEQDVHSSAITLISQLEDELKK